MSFPVRRILAPALLTVLPLALLAQSVRSPTAIRRDVHHDMSRAAGGDDAQRPSHLAWQA